jgi:hypothetical protein
LEGGALFAGILKLTKSASVSTPDARGIGVLGQVAFLRLKDSGGSVMRCPFLKSNLRVRGRNPVRGLYHLDGHGHEFFQTGTGDDDRVSTTVRFLGDTHKAPSFIFAEFNIEMLTLDLEFFRDNYVIHDALEEASNLTILQLTSHRRRRNSAK